MEITAFITQEHDYMLGSLTELVEILKENMRLDTTNYIEEEGEDPSIDIRLAIDNEKETYRSIGWRFWYGSSDYDSYHSQYCAASSVGLDTKPDELLKDLLNDI